MKSTTHTTRDIYLEDWEVTAALMVYIEEHHKPTVSIPSDYKVTPTFQGGNFTGAHVSLVFKGEE